MDNKKVTKQMTASESSSDEANTPPSADMPKSASAPVAKTPTTKKSKSASEQSPTKKTAAKLPVAKAVKATQVVKDSEPAAVKKTTKESPASIVAEHNVKRKKEKLVRDSFTMPESEYQALADIKKECLKAGITIKKSELLRVSLASLKLLSVTQIIAARDGLGKIQTGRPKKWVNK